MLNIEQVNTFIAVVDANSFIAASEQLQMAPPTVSQHIRKLEESLGKQLLHRSRTECRLTGQGEQFLPHARALLAAEMRARNSFIAKPSISIAASSNIGVYHLPSLLNRFADMFPPAERPSVKVHVGRNMEVHEHVRTGKADIALVEWVQPDDGMTSIAWAQERMVVIVGPQHPWAKRRHVNPDELFSTPMVAGEPGTGTARLLKEVFGNVAADLQMTMSLGSTEAVKRAVMAGLGVSIVMESAVTLEVEQGLLVALSVHGPVLEKTFHAVMPTDLMTQPIPHAFVRGALHKTLQ